MTWLSILSSGLVLVVAAGTVMSCASARSQTAGAGGKPPESIPRQESAKPAASLKYEGPAVSIEMPAKPGASPRVHVTFPTGGWELRADSASVKGGIGTARLTFVGPGKDEMVMQVLQQRVWVWPEPEELSRAEVWVNVVRRGQAPRSPDYRLAARHPAEP
jgi:hypothetical protein